MVVKTQYVPDDGEIVWLDVTPQSGHEQAGRRPGLVISPREYNFRSGLALICPVTNQKKGYPFEVVIPSFGGKTTGVVLADQVRSLDWIARNAAPRETVDTMVLSKVKEKLAILLGF